MHGGRSVGATAVKMGTGLAGLALAGTAAVALPGAAGAAGLPDGCTSYTPPLASTRVTCEFDSTGAAQTFHVPDGVTELDVMAVGGHGGMSLTSGSKQSAGGVGAVVDGTLDVTADSDLQVYVGGNGGDADGLGDDAGWNGGGSGQGNDGGGGGGASDVRTGTGLDTRLIVAAGGGGGGFDNVGGAAGQPGSGDQGAAGQPGTDVAGGDGGTGDRANGESGVAGAGGDGGANVQQFTGGGAGGGGWFGGGGGGIPANAHSGGGGGGSSLVPEGGTMTLAGEGDAPSVTISYTICTGSVCSMAGSLENLFGSLS